MGGARNHSFISAHFLLTLLLRFTYKCGVCGSICSTSSVITCVGKENATDIKKEIKSLAAKFRSMGEELGLQASELDIISKNCPNDCEEAFSRVIDTWLKQLYDTSRHGHPSWKKLVEAVATGGKNPALAQKIAAAHRGKMVSLNIVSIGGSLSC